MAFVTFGKKNTLAEAKSSNNRNKIFFPTNSSAIVFDGKEYGGVTQEDLTAALASVNLYISAMEGRLAALENPGYELVTEKPTASASTVGKMYLISKGDNQYERWITAVNGNSYSWIQLSDLGQLDLSGYVKAVSLTAEEYNALSTVEKNNGDYYFITEEQ